MSVDSGSSFQHKTALQGVTDTVKMAREYALLGQYATALVYFETVLGQIDEYEYS
jgi:hypothetical protein